MTATALTVGQPLPGASPPLPEGVSYQFDAGGHLLLASLADPTGAEVLAMRRGAIDLAFGAEATTLLVYVRASGALGWSACAYSPADVPEDLRAVPEPIGEGQGAALQIVLVDSRTAIVRAIRIVGLEHRFSVRLHETLRTLQTAPADPVADDRALRWTQQADERAVSDRVSRRSIARTTVPSRAQD